VTVPARPCLDCGTPCRGSRCPTHQRVQQLAKDARRPTRRSHHETQRRRQQVRDQPWCAACGTTTDLTAEHVVPVAEAVARGVPVEEAEAGPLTTLCLPCNSRLGATVRRC
jgi:5-methylcytosine-specific restriction endonuclease McrA